MTFNGVFDLFFDHPDAWPHANRGTAEADDIRMGEDDLGEELCVCGDAFFARSMLPLPIIGANQVFNIVCWGSLSKDSFERYLASVDSPGAFSGAFSWLANALPAFQMNDSVACDMIEGEPGKRPTLWAQAGSALHDAQTNGITFDHLLDIYAAAGTDIRAHLLT